MWGEGDLRLIEGGQGHGSRLGGAYDTESPTSPSSGANAPISPPSSPQYTAPNAAVTVASMCMGCFAIHTWTPVSNDLKRSVSSASGLALPCQHRRCGGRERSCAVALDEKEQEREEEWGVLIQVGDGLVWFGRMRHTLGLERAESPFFFLC
jgi:hypothetical protein